MLFDLVQDFSAAVSAMPHDHPRRRILTLLEEAIRRDIHFIDRHPTTLFQCLWNSCWWQARPAHQARPQAHSRPAWNRFIDWLRSLLQTRQAASPAEEPVGSQGSQLVQIVESWRHEKDFATPGFSWLRSLRPPALALGSGQLAVLRGHPDTVASVVCSGDGRLLGSADSAGNVLVWNLASGALIQGIRTGSKNRWWLSDDCQVLICHSGTTTENPILFGWNPVAGVELFRVPGIRSSALTITPGSRHVAGAGPAGDVHLWEAADGKAIASLVDPTATARVEPSSRCSSVWVRISPCGRHLASRAVDETVRLWAFKSGALLDRHEGVHEIAFSADGELWALTCYGTGNRDGVLRVLRIRDGAELFSAALPGLWGSHLIRFSDDGNRLATQSESGTIRLWDLKRQTGPISLRGDTYTLSGLQFSANGTRLLSWDIWSARLWDAATGAELTQITGRVEVSEDISPAVAEHLEHENQIRSATFTPDGKRFVLGIGRAVQLHDSTTGARVRAFLGHDDVVMAVAVCPDNRLVVSGSADRALCVWDSAVDTPEGQHHGGHHSRVSSAAFSSDGKWLATGGWDCIVRLWDPATGVELKRLAGHQGAVLKVIFSSDNTRALSGSQDHTTRTWALPDGKCIDVSLRSLADVTNNDAAWQPALQLVPRDDECQLESVVTGQPICWFPVGVDQRYGKGVYAHPTENEWAITCGRYLALLVLEGETSGSNRQPPSPTCISCSRPISADTERCAACAVVHKYGGRTEVKATEAGHVVVKVDLSGTHVTDADLKHLAGMAQLSTLALNMTSITDAGLAHLESLPQLEAVALCRTLVSDAGLVHVGRLKRLRLLNLDMTQVTDAGLAHLAHLSQLAVLRLGGTRVSRTGLVQLRHLNQLDQLYHDACPTAKPPWSDR
jgi:WD40 repeat protein